MKKILTILIASVIFASPVFATDFTDTDQMYGWNTSGTAQFYQTWADHKTQLGLLYQPLSANLTEYATTNPSANGLSLISAADYAAMALLQESANEAVLELQSLQGAVTTSQLPSSGTWDASGLSLTLPDDSVDIATLSATGTPSSSTFLRGDNTWAIPAGGGTVGTSGTPILNDFARFTDATTIEGRSYAEVRSDLDLEAGTDFYSITAADAAFQPLNANLTEYATTNPSANGLSLISAADYAAMALLQESANEAVLDLQDLQGAVTDAQVPDTITVSNYLPLAGGTLTGELVADELGIEFQETDTITDCSSFAATGGGIFFDDSEGVLKKCQDNVLTDLDTGTGGAVGTSGTPVLNDFARFTDATTIEGRSYAEVRSDLDLEAGTDFYSITAADAAFQPLNANLTEYATTNPSADGLTLISAADYATMALQQESANEAVLDLQSLQGAVTDGQVPNDITIDLATLATTFTATANNTTDETVYPVFVDGATGAQGAETDTDLSYNPNTNTLSVEVFASTAADGDHYLDVINTIAITATPTLGRISYYNGEMRLANGSNWTSDYFLRFGALGTNVLAFLGTPSSANLRAALTDESGTGVALFDGFTLGAAADFGDFDITSVDRLEGFDSAVALDLGADGIAQLIADSAIHLDIGAETLIVTSSTNAITLGTDTGATEINTALDFVTTGKIHGGINTSLKTVDTYTVGTDDTDESKGTLFVNNDNDGIVFTLDAADTGKSMCFAQGAGVSGIIGVTPASGDQFIAAGVAQTAATEYASGGDGGDKLCIVAIDSTFWLITAETGTWAE